MATTTLQDIREEMIDQYGLGRRGTNTGASQTAITDDASFGGHSGAEGIEPGCYVRITSGTDAPDGEVTRLSSRPGRTTGTMNLDPGLSAALAATDTFEVLYKPFSYTAAFGLHPAINKALEIIPEKLLVPITEVKDGDMLLPAVTNWTTQDSNAVSSKSTTAFPFALRELFVNNSGANGYTHSGTIAVEGGASYYLEATVRAVAGTAKLILYDETNSAAITLDDDDSTQTEPEILFNTGIQVPSTCKSISVRLGADGATDDSYWSNVIFRKNSLRQFVVQDRGQIDRLGQMFVASHNGWGERTFEPIGAELEQRRSNMWVYHTAESLAGCSVWYEEYRKPVALTADTSTASVPKEHVAAVAAEILLQPLSDQDRWRAFYLKAARRAAAARAKYATQQTIVNQAPRLYALPEV